jgi:hypothetical protein
MAKNIFPSSIYQSDKDKEARERLQAFSDRNMEQNLQFQQEASVDALLEAGDQEALNRLGFDRVLSSLDMYTFNKIKRMVSFHSGLQRRERKSTICTPRELGDQRTADQFTKVLFHTDHKQNVLESVSDVHQSALTTGLALLQFWVDYRDDPISGDIKCDVCPYNSFIIDANFKKPDLSDCNGIWKRSYLTTKECQSLLPEHKDKIENLSRMGTGNDDLFPYLAASYWKSDDFLSYDEFFYRDSRWQQMLIDTVTGEKQEYSGQDDEILKLLLQKNPQIILEEGFVPTAKLSILINGTVFYDGLNPNGIDLYPFVPFFCYRSEQVNDMYLKFQGVARGMRDSQFLFNLMTSLEVEYVQTRVNPGAIYKPSSMIDPGAVDRRDLSGNFAMKKNFGNTNTMEDIKFINPGDIPSSLPLIREQVAKELIENDGGNEESFGSSGDDIAGLLAMMRSRAGETLMQPVLDSLDRSQGLAGNVELALIQANYTPGKIRRIIEEEPTVQFYNKTFAKYDCIVEEGVNTSSQRQHQFATMMILNRQTNIDLPAEAMLKASTIQNKQEIIDYMNDVAKQQEQAQQQETQITQQLQQAEAALAQAKANYDNAGAMQRQAKIVEDRTQAISNLAEANKDDEQATLNKIKAVKELESIDLSNLEKLIAIANSVNAAEQQAKARLATVIPGSPAQGAKVKGVQ